MNRIAVDLTLENYDTLCILRNRHGFSTNQVVNGLFWFGFMLAQEKWPGQVARAMGKPLPPIKKGTKKL